MNMQDSFPESEKFRANIHLLIGTALSSPLCLTMLELLKDNEFPPIVNILVSLLLAIPGYLIINNSYLIMYSKEYGNNGN